MMMQERGLVVVPIAVDYGDHELRVQLLSDKECGKRSCVVVSCAIAMVPLHQSGGSEN
jgi:hypothetical protein